MVQKTKQKVAKKIGVPGEILIPVDNIIKVEDLERELKEKERIIADLSKENAELKKRLGLK